MLPISNKAKLLEIFNVKQDIIVKKPDDDEIEVLEEPEKVLEIAEEVLDTKPDTNEKEILLKSDRTKIENKVPATFVSDKEKLKKHNNNEAIVIIIKKSNTSYLPYTSVLLEKKTTDNSEEMSFIKLKFEFDSMEDKLSQLISKEFDYDFIKVKNQLSFLGFKDLNTPILIYNLLFEEENEIKLFKRNNKHWWCLQYELINTLHVCNFEVNYDVTKFFIDNNEIVYLYDENNKQLEMPISLYFGNDNKNIKFTSLFGVKRTTSELAMAGPFYYLTDYKGAIESGAFGNYEDILNGGISQDSKRIDQGGIVRFAVFTRKIYSFIYHPNNREDDSEVVNELLDKFPDSENLRKSLKYRDHDGDWSNVADTAYIGPITEKESNKKVTNYPLFVLKDMKQQVPLTYHNLDLDKFPDNFDDSRNDYYIL